MWNISWVVAVEIVARTSIVYLALVLGIRLSGKRQIGQMTPFDLVVLLLLSNAVQNAMTGPDTSVPGGLVAALTLLILNQVVAMLRLGHPTLRRLVVGSPVPLIQHGHIQYDALRSERMTIDDLMANLREHDCHEAADVDYATLEVDGEVSVVRRTADPSHRWVRTRKKLVRHHKK